MPAAGRKDGKYVTKIHWVRSYRGGSLLTLCGRHLHDPEHTADDPNDVTCVVCKKALGIRDES